ncbi:MAG: rhomboid family intramembrane serine protease [Anaerolinea sp.]|nr:rhomboid family intramembrane serine protease [Anaerolinea sp.]
MNTNPPPLTPTPPAVFWHLRSRTPTVTIAMIVVCIFIYIGQMVSLAITGYDIPALYASKINPLILQGQIWRLITPMFLHGSITHVAFNMYALYSIGRQLEQQYGHLRYAMLLLLGGLAGNVFSFLFTTAPSYGASTAVFGLVAAEGVFIFQNRRLFRNPFGMIMNTLTIVAINLLIGVSSSGIDNWGHLGGLLGGLMFAAFAGPILKPEMHLDGLHLINSISDDRAWIVSFLTAVCFLSLAFAKIFGLIQ